jgi:tetratricopeptide (TPR) repeat protein
LLAGLGKRGEAEAAYRRALVIEDKLAADSPTVPEYRRALAGSHNNLGNLLGDLGKHAEAEAAFRQALVSQERLAADFPSVREYRQNLASGHYSLGVLLYGLKKHGEAEAAFRRALSIREKLAADFPTVPVYRHDLASSQDSLGSILAKAVERQEAEAAYREAMGIREKLATDFPTVPEYGVGLAGTYFNFGNLIRDSGQPEAALVWYQKAIERLGPMVAQEPRLATARQFLCYSYLGRATALDALGRHIEATRDWEHALKLDDGSLKQELLSRLIDSRLRTFRKDKDAAGCLATATEYEGLKRGDAEGLYNAACCRAICAAAIREDPKAPAADAGRLAREQADLAMAWLRKAVAAGFNDAELMKKDTDLDALRANLQFKALLTELTKGKADKK